MRPPETIEDRMTQPRFDSLALDLIPSPDYADAIVIPLPDGASSDPRVWAETMFGRSGTPAWVGVALQLRQALVPLIGVSRAPSDVFAVDRVCGEEALIVARDGHLDFGCAVGVDAERRLVRVTTTVRLKGLRGRLYFAPVRLAHPVVVHAMVTRTARILARTSS